jgi:hypothetical protein
VTEGGCTHVWSTQHLLVLVISAHECKPYYMYLFVPNELNSTATDCSATGPTAADHCRKR